VTAAATCWLSLVLLMVLGMCRVLERAFAATYETEAHLGAPELGI